MRWRITFEFDIPNDHSASKVGDTLRDVLAGMAENVNMTEDVEVNDVPSVAPRPAD